MPDPKSRARVERLLNGPFRPDDLTHLFLYARDHCDQRKTVEDLGAFVAHHHEREKGLVTQSTRDWFTVARFHFWRFAPGTPGDPPPSRDHQPSRMHPATRDYFRIAVNRLGHDLIKRETGMKLSQAYKLMQSITERLKQNGDGTWALPFPLTRDEANLVRCVSSVIAINPAFEGPLLAQDFLATLKSNALISKGEIRQNRKRLETLISLFAVSAMHNSIIVVGNERTKLKAYADASKKTIEIGSTVNGSIQPGLGIRAAMFIAHLDPEVHCHPELVGFQNEWETEIELGLDERLAPLR